MFEAAAALKIVDDGQYKMLESLVSSGKTPQKIALRAHIVLMAARGVSNNQIAKKLKTSRPTVLLWRERFDQFGCPGLIKDCQRPGRKPKISDEKVQEVIERTLHTKPEVATHWSTRSLGKEVGLSHVAVHRIWKQHGLQPHKS